MRESSSRRLRIMHLPTNVGGFASGISRVEKNRGLESSAVVFEDSFTKFPVDEILYSSDAPVLRKEFLKWQLFWRAIFHFDVIHFNFGQKFFPYHVRPWKAGEPFKTRIIRILFYIYGLFLGRFDLWLLHLFGKKMFVTFQGDDIRQGDYCRAHYPVHFVNHVEPGYYDAFSDNRKRALVHLFDRYCDGLFALNPDLLNVLPSRAEFLPYSHIDLKEWSPVESRNARLKIVHAPSNRNIKGTEFILKAIQSLRDRGYQFDFEVVEGLPNASARAVYESADLLIDQLFAGWYGGLSIELMALGKPVICYLREEDMQRLPKDFVEELPIINANSENIAKVLEEYLMDPKKLTDIGKRSRSFVEKYHDPERVFEELQKHYFSESRQP